MLLNRPVGVSRGQPEPVAFLDFMLIQDFPAARLWLGCEALSLLERRTPHASTLPFPPEPAVAEALCHWLLPQPLAAAVGKPGGAHCALGNAADRRPTGSSDRDRNQPAGPVHYSLRAEFAHQYPVQR